MNNSQPLNNFVFLLAGFLNKEDHHDYEQAPNPEKIVRERKAEDIQEGPVQKERAQEKKKRP